MTQALLNNVDHHDLKVRAGGITPEDRVNLALIFPTEFVEAAREYPILFRRGEQGDFFAVALLGLDAGENLFLDADGWTGRYVPATLRRGPFSIAMQERDVGGEVQQEPMIHVDMDDARVGDADGQPVFLPHGGNSPYLDYVTTALRAIYTGISVAPGFHAALLGAGLLKPVKLEIKVADHKRYDLDRFFAIDEEALAALDGERLTVLSRAGFLGPIYAAAHAFGNMSRLIELKGRVPTDKGA